jgi:hypothetical protein
MSRSRDGQSTARLGCRRCGDDITRLASYKRELDATLPTLESLQQELRPRGISLTECSLLDLSSEPQLRKVPAELVKAVVTASEISDEPASVRVPIQKRSSSRRTRAIRRTAASGSGMSSLVADSGETKRRYGAAELRSSRIGVSSSGRMRARGLVLSTSVSPPMTTFVNPSEP